MKPIEDIIQGDKMFEINKEKSEIFNNWEKEHDKTCGLAFNSGAIGGRYTYCFTPTSLGTVIEVKCACGESIDLTNYKEW